MSIRDLLEKAKVPGALELKAMCKSANQVKQICDALGYEFRGYEPMIRDAIAAEEAGVSHVDIEDGAWILPEEVAK